MANYPDIDALIAKFEGFGQSGVPATVNNNPGNLIAGPFSTAQGAIGQNGAFAVFPDAATGFAAADALVTKYAEAGLTVEQLINKWAPSNAVGNSPTSTNNYVDYVSQALNTSKQTPVAAIPQTGSTDQPAGTSAIIDALGKILLAGSQAPGKAGSGITDAVTAPLWYASSRGAAFFLGLILIAGAVYLFKPDLPGQVIDRVQNGIEVAGAASKLVP